MKIRQGKPETAQVLSAVEAAKLDGVVKSEQPNNSLYTFEATMTLGTDKEFPLDPMQLLLRVRFMNYIFVFYWSHLNI